MSTKRDSSAPSSSLDDSSSPSSKRQHTAANDLNTLCINSLRCLSAALPQIANSGHPGAPMGCAGIGHALFGRVMNFSSKDPLWANRDRFVLSNGHACALQYTLLFLLGYPGLTLDSLKQFRKVNSCTPGHPENDTAGVEVCTGPLGQGISNAVGMALASAHMRQRFNKEGGEFAELFNNYVYCICGDGCLQEGISSEACSLAGHLGLGRLVVLYDSNHITIDGDTSLSFTENVAARYRAYNWQVLGPVDGDHDFEGLCSLVEEGKAETARPTIVVVNTTIGFGSLKSGTAKVHGTPLGQADLIQARERFGLEPKDDFFHVHPDVLSFYRSRAADGDSKATAWWSLVERYVAAHPAEGDELRRRIALVLPDGALEALPSFAAGAEASATRALSGKCLNALVKVLPEIVGGSGDLTGSNCSALDGEAVVSSGQWRNRYIHYGVREHAMAAISNGIFAYGLGFRPFAATFLNFITYAWGAVRLSALGKFGVLFIATHDSIELGEDGATHQPIETIPLIRATPNIILVRPADGRETVGGYKLWIQNVSRPTVMALCRSAVPHLSGTSSEGAQKGAYVVEDFEKQNNVEDEEEEKGGKQKKKKMLILAGSGSELQLCVTARKELMELGFKVRVVSFVCWEVFEDQTEKYREEVMMGTARRRADVVTAYVEAASNFGWDKYFDVHLGMSTFGKSGAKKDVMEHFGFTSDNLVVKVLYYCGETQLMEKRKEKGRVAEVIGEK